jgi:hypothetical protein
MTVPDDHIMETAIQRAKLEGLSYRLKQIEIHKEDPRWEERMRKFIYDFETEILAIGEKRR